MKIINNSGEFVLQYNGSDFKIPAGEFEIGNENLARHITFIANKWGKDVKEVGKHVDLEIKQVKVEPIIQKKEEAVAEKAPEVVEEVGLPPVGTGNEPAVVPKRRGRPARNA